MQPGRFDPSPSSSSRAARAWCSRIPAASCWPERFKISRWSLARWLRLGVALCAALGASHRRGIIHRDVTPAHVMIDETTGYVRLTGFRIASRRRREPPPSESPEVIAGTLPYMAPEQTGRLNRSVDSRSDLYALGVLLYEMSTGTLPFSATDPLEWVHCHLARQPIPPAERVHRAFRRWSRRSSCGYSRNRQRSATRPPPELNAICGAAWYDGRSGDESTTSRSANTTSPTSY